MPDEATMGRAGEINITQEMMTAAIKAIDAYRAAAEQEYANIENAVNSLGIGSEFKGSAASGYQTFYTDKVQPMLKKEDGSLAQLLDALKSICESTRDQIPGGEGVDDELGKINKQ